MISGLGLLVFNPLHASAAGTSETPTYVDLFNSTATPSADGAIYHTVLEGQVPYTIALMYGIDVYTLLANNNLENNAILNIGDVLLIRNANELLPGEVVITPTHSFGNSSSGTPVTGVGTADTVGSLGGGANGTASGSGLGSGTKDDDLNAIEAEEDGSEEGMSISYEQLQAQMIGQFSLSGALVNLSGTPVPPELAMSAALNGEAYILLPNGESGQRTATAVTNNGVTVLTIGEQKALAIPAIQAVALAPNAEKLTKSSAVTPNLVERIFSNNTKYLALAVILMVLIGLLLLVISTRRLKQ